MEFDAITADVHIPSRSINTPGVQCATPVLANVYLNSHVALGKGVVRFDDTRRVILSVLTQQGRRKIGIVLQIAIEKHSGKVQETALQLWFCDLVLKLL